MIFFDFDMIDLILRQLEKKNVQRYSPNQVISPMVESNLPTNLQQKSVKIPRLVVEHVFDHKPRVAYVDRRWNVGSLETNSETRFCQGIGRDVPLPISTLQVKKNSNKHPQLPV